MVRVLHIHSGRWNVLGAVRLASTRRGTSAGILSTMIGADAIIHPFCDACRPPVLGGHNLRFRGGMQGDFGGGSEFHGGGFHGGRFAGGGRGRSVCLNNRWLKRA